MAPSHAEGTGHVGWMLMKYSVMNEKGAMKTRTMQGTAFLISRISKDIYLITTPAHNFVQFEEHLGNIITKFASEAVFLLGCNGQEYKFKFDMVEFIQH